MELRLTIDEGRMVEIARAAQALAPRVAQSILKQAGCIHSMFDVHQAIVGFRIAQSN